MKLSTRMPKSLAPFFKKEIASYGQYLSKGDLHRAWHHLERAHILGQAFPYQHTYVHWKMLQFGVKIKSGKEVLGQIPRLLAGGVKSFVGCIPVGNTGGANVPPFKPMPFSPEIREIFKKAGVEISGKVSPDAVDKPILIILMHLFFL